MPDQATPNDAPVLSAEDRDDLTTASRADLEALARTLLRKQARHDRAVTALNTQIRLRDGDVLAAQSDIERLTKELSAARELAQGLERSANRFQAEAHELRRALQRSEADRVELDRSHQQLHADFAAVQEQKRVLAEERELLGQMANDRADQASTDRKVLYRHRHTLRVVAALANEARAALIDHQDRDAAEQALDDIAMAADERLNIPEAEAR